MLLHEAGDRLAIHLGFSCGLGDIAAVPLQQLLQVLKLKSFDELILGIPAGGWGARIGAMACFGGAAIMATLTVATGVLGGTGSLLFMGTLPAVLATVFVVVGKRLWQNSHRYHWLIVRGDEVTLIQQTMDGGPKEETLGFAWAPEVVERVVHNSDTGTTKMVDLVFESEKGRRHLHTALATDVRFTYRLLRLITPHLYSERPQHLGEPGMSSMSDEDAT